MQTILFGMFNGFYIIDLVQNNDVLEEIHCEAGKVHNISEAVKYQSCD